MELSDLGHVGLHFSIQFQFHPDRTQYVCECRYQPEVPIPEHSETQRRRGRQGRQAGVQPQPQPAEAHVSRCARPEVEHLTIVFLSQVNDPMLLTGSRHTSEFT